MRSAPRPASVSDRHEPSACRGLVRALKAGKDPAPLFEEACGYKQGVYRAEGLAAVGAAVDDIDDIDTSLPHRITSSLLDEPDQWRRAEALKPVTGHIIRWSDHNARSTAFDELFTLLSSFTESPSLKDASRNLSRQLGHEDQHRMLVVVTNLEQGAHVAVRQVLRSMISSATSSSGLERITEHLSSLDADLATRSLDVLCGLAKKAGLDTTRAFAAACEKAPDASLETARTLCSHTSSLPDLLALESALVSDDGGVRSIRLLLTLQAQADRNGAKQEAEVMMTRAERISASLSEAELPRIITKVERSRARLDGVEDAKTISSPHALKAPLMVVSEHGRHTLALVNTYTGGLSIPHFRALARAAGLAHGFGLEVLVVGWPSNDLAALCEKTAASSGMEGSEYLLPLLAKNRIRSCMLEDLLDGSHDEGHLVATTNDAPSSFAPSGKGRICALIGLGRHGLPGKVMDSVPDRWDVTGLGTSLETSVAMGAIATSLGALE